MTPGGTFKAHLRSSSPLQFPGIRRDRVRTLALFDESRRWARCVLRLRFAMNDNDDVRFSNFTRDLARRHRRPRAYAPPPPPADALEQLCGGGLVVPPHSPLNPYLPDSLLAFDIDFDED